MNEPGWRSKLDLSVDVRSTSAMKFCDTHVLCQHIEIDDVYKHYKTMARQRCVGASGDSTG